MGAITTKNKDVQIVLSPPKKPTNGLDPTTGIKLQPGQTATNGVLGGK